MSIPRAELSWWLLDESALPAVVELARACLSADGGQPFAASSLYLSRGLSQVLAEDVMQLAAGSAADSVTLPPVRASADLALSQWGQAAPERFHAVYEAAFRERPGFPAWPRERWIEWISGDDDFRPEWTLLATLGGADVAFIASDAGGWIAQLGVVPSARGLGLGARVITEAVRRMCAAGETVITLNVNTNNPHAVALYRGLGFTRTGRRARYQVRA